MCTVTAWYCILYIRVNPNVVQKIFHYVLHYLLASNVPQCSMHFFCNCNQYKLTSRSKYYCQNTAIGIYIIYYHSMHRQWSAWQCAKCTITQFWPKYHLNWMKRKCYIESLITLVPIDKSSRKRSLYSCLLTTKSLSGSRNWLFCHSISNCKVTSMNYGLSWWKISCFN